jgi:hypothetical protein
VTFVFVCGGCGSVLFRDECPLLCGGEFKSLSYLESVLGRLGGRCPFCGRVLVVPPLRVEVSGLERCGGRLRGSRGKRVERVKLAAG